MIKTTFALLGLSSTLVSSLLAPLPRATNNIGEAMGFGWSPAPTSAPKLAFDLVKRAGKVVGYLGPDNTCGYVSGVSSSSKTCGASELCAAVIVSGVASMGCCDGTGSCQFLGQCYNSKEIPSQCDKNCQADPNIVKCSAASAPFCYSFLVPGMTMGFYSCAASTSSDFAPFFTTANGAKEARSWTPVYDDSSSGGGKSTPPFLLIAATASVTNGFSSVTPASSGTVPTETLLPINGGGKKKKTPVGAIAGGVVGGLFVLGAIAVGLVILCVKKRQTKTTAVGTKQISPPSSVAPGTNSAMPSPMPMAQNGAGYPGQPGYNQQIYFTQNQGHDAYSGPNENVYAPPISPLHAYSNVSPAGRTMSPPPQMFTPPPPSNPHGPPPGVFEAGSIPIQPSPKMNGATPSELGSPPMQPSQPQPVEMGTGYSIPTKNPQGAPVFEAQ